MERHRESPVSRSLSGTPGIGGPSLPSTTSHTAIARTATSRTAVAGPKAASRTGVAPNAVGPIAPAYTPKSSGCCSLRRDLPLRLVAKCQPLELQQLALLVV
jgi:hypothetical protein